MPLMLKLKKSEHDILYTFPLLIRIVSDFVISFLKVYGHL
jgi:hypothetical protein